MRGPARLTELPGIGPKTSTVVVQALAGAGARLPGRPGETTSSRWPTAARSSGPALRGDLHSHSDWSDGGSPIQEMAVTAMELGHEYQALTDHSPRLTVANGLTAGAAGAAAGHRRDAERAPRRLPAAVRHRVRHQRGRHPRPDRRAARPGRHRRRLRALQAAVRLGGDDPADAAGDRRTRTPTSSGTAPGGWSPAAAAPGRRASSTPTRCSPPAPSTGRGGDQLPAGTARPAAAAAAARRSRRAACSASTPTRTRPASWTGSPTAARGRRSAACRPSGSSTRWPVDELLAWTNRRR